MNHISHKGILIFLKHYLYKYVRVDLRLDTNQINQNHDINIFYCIILPIILKHNF